MKSVPSFQQCIEQLAAKHGLALNRTGAYLRLQLEGHGHLVIENIGAARVSVTHYVPVGNDLVADPEVVVFMDSRAGSEEPSLWIPLEITEVFGSWQLFAELDLQGNLLVHDPVGQAELAQLCEVILVRNLTRQGWLASALRANVARPPWSEAEIHARDIRLDEMP